KNRQPFLRSVRNGFSDNSAGLPPREPNIVGPFECNQLRRDRFKCFSDSNSCDQAELWYRGQRHTGTQNHGHVKVYPRRRVPATAKTSPAGGLAFRDDNGTLISPFLGERSGDPLRRVDLVEVTDITANPPWNS